MFPVFTVARHRAEVEAANAVDAVASHGMHVGDSNLNNSAQDRLGGVVPLDESTCQHGDCGVGTSPVTCVGILLMCVCCVTISGRNVDICL